MKRHILIAAAVLSAFAAGLFMRIQVELPRAQASYQVTSAGPTVTFDTTELERQAAAFMAAQGITTNAQRATAVNGITAGSAAELAAVKAVLNSLTLVP